MDSRALTACAILSAAASLVGCYEQTERACPSSTAWLTVECFAHRGAWVADYDEEGDGVVEWRTTRTQRVWSYDRDADGTIEYRITYDDAGNELSHEWGDGEGVLVGWWQRDYDRDGNVLVEVSPSEDGMITTRWTYDRDGNTLSEERELDAVLQHRRSWSYAPDGSLALKEDDHDGDGSADSRWSGTYDDRGNLLVAELDEDADGTIDNRHTMTYDAADNLTSHTEDPGADGTPNRRRTWTYDADGNRLSAELDRRADGVIDRRETWTYDRGRLVRRELDWNADGEPEQVSHYHSS